nr:putative receptor-like protein kinase At3g47110 [Ipomoea batatas]
MLTGRRPTDELFKDGLNLHSYAKAALPDRGMEIAHPKLVQQTDDKFQVCLVSMITIGVACSMESPADRMNIHDIVSELSKANNDVDGAYLELCANLTLADVEDEDISVHIANAPIEQSDGDDVFYVVCRVVTDKQIRFPYFQDTMAGVWRPTMGVTMRQLPPQRFLVRFYNEADCTRNLVQTDERNFDGSMCIFYRVRVAIDVAKPLKKQMKLKKDNGSWAFIDFRYERLPTFCFRCGLIGHGDRFCPKIAQGYDPKAEKLYGAWLRAGTRRTMPTSGQRWVAPESNADRLNWRSPAMESDKGEGVDDGGNMGAAPMQMVTSPNVLLPVVKANHKLSIAEMTYGVGEEHITRISSAELTIVRTA